MELPSSKMYSADSTKDNSASSFRHGSDLSPFHQRKRVDERNLYDDTGGWSSQGIKPLSSQASSLSKISTSTSYVDAAAALESTDSTSTSRRVRADQQNSPVPEVKEIPDVDIVEPSALTLALTRLVDLEAQMEYEFAKFMQLEVERQILAVKYEHMQTLPIGFDAFTEDYQNMFGPTEKDMDHNSVPMIEG
jgi:hypothetical protein